MSTLANNVYRDSQFGVLQDLPRAGSSLENPYVFDATARELKAFASRGLVEIVSEHLVVDGTEPLIDRLKFKRLR